MLDAIKPLTSADQPTFPKALAFVGHCASLLDADGLLRAARFELPRMPKLAPYLAILGAVAEGEDFVVRLVGTRLVEFLGADPTGLKLSQVPTNSEFGQRSWHIAREVFRTKRPMLNQPGRTRMKSKDYLRLETVTYPLVDDAGQVNKVVSFYDYLWEKQPATA